MSTSKRLAWEILRRKPEYRELWANYAEALYRKEHATRRQVAGASVKVLDLTREFLQRFGLEAPMHPGAAYDPTNDPLPPLIRIRTGATAISGDKIPNGRYEALLTTNVMVRGPSKRLLTLEVDIDQPMDVILLAMEDTVHAVKAGLLEAQEADVGAR